MMPLLLALAIGASLTLLGAGGSIITVPVLVYAAGLDVHRAAGTSLLVVGLVSAVGALGRRTAIDVRTGLQFGVAGMVGALPGAWLNHHVPAPLLLVGFAAVVLATAERMLRPVPPGAPSRSTTAWVSAAGIGVGFATGLFGVGGGFLIVPALTLLLGMSMRRAVATSLLVIALNSAAGLAAHGRYGAVDWRLGFEFGAAALLGAAATLPLARRVRSDRLQRAFAFSLVLLGLGMLGQLIVPWLGADVVRPLAGGALIGLGASVLLVAANRIAGISGIVGGLLGARPGDRAWRIAFVVGLFAGGVVLRVVHPAAFTGLTTASNARLLAAGLLVGFGARLGNGCTSGHGVCGISRWSPRSLVATATFMTTGGLCVFVVRHLLGGGS